MLTRRIAGTFKTVHPSACPRGGRRQSQLSRKVQNPATVTTILRCYRGGVIYPFHRRTQSPSVLNCELGTGLYPPGFLHVFLRLRNVRWAGKRRPWVTIPDSPFQWAPQRERACLVGRCAFSGSAGTSPRPSDGFEETLSQAELISVSDSCFHGQRHRFEAGHGRLPQGERAWRVGVSVRK